MKRIDLTVSVCAALACAASWSWATVRPERRTAPRSGVVASHPASERTAETAPAVSKPCEWSDDGRAMALFGPRKPTPPGRTAGAATAATSELHAVLAAPPVFRLEFVGLAETARGDGVLLRDRESGECFHVRVGERCAPAGVEVCAIMPAGPSRAAAVSLRDARDNGALVELFPAERTLP